jgi:hypothetical protein
MPRKVSMVGMKKLASDMENGPLRDDLLQQPDEIGVEEFLACARMWLRLAKNA